MSKLTLVSGALAIFLAGCVSVGGVPEHAAHVPVARETPPPETPEIEPAPRLDTETDPVEVEPTLDPDEEIPVTRDGAILTALRNNQSLDVVRFGPRLAATGVPQARARFDPSLMGTASYGKQRNQLGGVQQFTFGTAGIPGMGEDAGPLDLLTQLPGSDPRTAASGVLGFLSRQVGQPPREVDLEQEITSGALGFMSEQLAPQRPSYIETEMTRSNLRVSNFFPTGTSVFLSGGLSRTESNFIPTEYEGQWTVGVNQALLRGRGTDVNLVNLRQAQHETTKSAYELEEFLLQFISRVEQAYWRLVLAQEVLTIREFAVELAEEQLERTEDLVEVGRAVKGAALSARAEKASREAQLHQARGDVRNATIGLLRLMNAPEDTGWEWSLKPGDEPEVQRVDVDRLESEQLAQHYRPDLRQLLLDSEIRDLDVLAARDGRLPDLELSAEYGLTSLGGDLSGGLRHLDETRFYDYNVGLELNVPLLNRAEKARHRRAELASKQAMRRLLDQGQEVRTEVRQALNDVQAAWQSIEANQLAVDSREEELRIEEDRYEVGLVTHLDVLQVQRLLIEAQVNEVTARVNYIQALTDLYAKEGTLLQRRGVQLEDDETW
ncbi:MAG: TolC family protein [Candidatus Hydrogenedentota bacterium]